jgi:hypothetical protein
MHLVSKVALDVPKLGEPFMLEPKEVDVELSDDPLRDRGTGQIRNVRGCRVEIHVPFTGDRDLFHCRPSTFTYSPPYAQVFEDHIALIYDRPGQLKAEDIKTDYERTMREIHFYLTNAEAQCNAFNSQLETRIRQMIADRKTRLLQNRQAGANIGLPLKRRAGAPQTYVVPGIKRKPEIQRPAVKEKAFIPEPALVEQEYENILFIIRGMVNVMERSPKAFAHMGEEDLRTHFLVQLNGQYQGRATGETFNFQGKTDILIREGDRNVFIAECKIWKGGGELLKAIDQILSYLHWRDTKTALLVFNRNKSLSDVLSKVTSAVQSHPCCKRLATQTSETEWRFVFRNADDSNRELQLAVMVFDVPKESA